MVYTSKRTASIRTRDAKRVTPQHELYQLWSGNKDRMLGEGLDIQVLTIL